MKKIIAAICAIFIIGVIVLVVKAFQIPEKPTHYHANFGIYENNIPIDYSEAKYMDLKPCTVDQHDPLLNNKNENIHLHNLEGKTIHLHQDGISWDDVLKKLKYDYSKANTLIYLDKNLVDAAELKKVIKNNQTLFIHVGKVDSVEVDQNPTLKSEYAAIGNKSAFYNSAGSSIENCGGVDKRTFLNRLQIALYKW
jgi:hypothetical protein